jgi:hypothetical protein
MKKIKHLEPNPFVISLKSEKTLMENVFDELFNAGFITFLKLMQRYNTDRNRNEEFRFF